MLVGLLAACGPAPRAPEAAAPAPTADRVLPIVPTPAAAVPPAAAATLLMPTQPTPDPTTWLFTFARPEDTTGWFIVNDGVMGGVSQSQLDAGPAGEGHARFSGSLSLDNFGGFASVRAVFEPVDVSGYGQFVVRARGDGRTYMLQFTTAEFGDRVTYTADFVTGAGEWQIAGLPVKGFVPTFRGRLLDAPPPDLTRLRSLTIMIADKQAGPFQIDLGGVGVSR